MKTDSLASGNYSISQISLPLESVFPSLGSIFQTNPSLQQVARIFFLFLLDETVFLIFFQILIRMEVAFRSSKIAFFKEYFILASGNRCSINYKLCRFIWIFFSWWTQFLKLGVNQFFSIFSIPNSGRSFRASGNHYSK